MNRLRAENLHVALAEAARIEAARAEAAHGRERVQVLPEMATVPGGEVGPDAVVLYLARSLLTRLTRYQGDEATGRLLDEVRADLPGEIRDQVAAKLKELASEPAEVVDVRLRATEDNANVLTPSADSSVPTRITALQPTDAGGMSWSALTARATVPEREVRLDRDLLAELIRRLTAPEQQDAEELPYFLTRFLVPLDLRAYLSGDAPLIVEVDPRTARVPWEFLMAAGDAVENLEPLAVRQPLARQMRTTYARTDIDAPAPQEMRALVIGDPGGTNLSLDGARMEAVAVASVLKRHGIRVEAYIGSADSPPTEAARPATRLDVLAKVLTGRYDLIHYAGHGVFDPEEPEMSGWLFADGLLTARELTQMSRAPWLVMANACWSAARPDTGRIETTASQPTRGREGELAPVLADEFLRVGVGHFVGASWRVPDGNARDFAVHFYEQLLGEGEAPRENVGQALLAARREQWLSSRSGPQATPEQRNAWAAYQHYGDPGDGLRTRVLSNKNIGKV
jgi:hypothetical protein